MYKLIRFYNRNRKKIFIVLLIIAFIIFIIQLLNYLTAKNNERGIENNDVNQVQNLGENDTFTSNRSSITGDKLSEGQIKLANNVIKSFIDACNEKKIEEAYNMLSSDCKSEIFKTQEDFLTQYYNSYFNGDKRIYTIENWAEDIYKVNLTGDILATGNIDDGKGSDFYTIVMEDGEYKLNIRGFIGKTIMKKEVTEKDINIKILSKNIHMDYETYDIEIINNSKSSVLLDSKNTTKSLYLQDSKEVKYYALTNEIIWNDFIVRPRDTKQLRLKFNNSYSYSRKIKYMIFSDLIFNYEEYEKVENKDQYEDRERFIINL